MIEPSTPPPEPIDETGAQPGTPLNLHQAAVQRRVLRSAARDSSAPMVLRSRLDDELATVTARIHDSWTIASEGGLAAAKQRLRRERTAAEQLLSEAAVTEQFGTEAEQYHGL